MKADKAWRGSLDALFATVDIESQYESYFASLVAQAEPPLPYHLPPRAAAAASLTLAGRNLDQCEDPRLPALLAAKFGLLPCLLAATTLGKLGRHTSCADRQRRVSLAMFAQPLWRAAFALSLAHPSRLCDFALYTPSVNAIFAGFDPFSDPLRLSARACLASLEHCIRCLIAQVR